MKKIIQLILLCAVCHESFAQAPKEDKPLIGKGAFADTAGYVDEAGYKTRLFPSMIVPGILIGYGLLTWADKSLYSDIDARNSIQRFAKYGSGVDDYLIFSPYVEFALLLAFQVDCKNDLINTALLIAKTEVIMLGLTFPLKYIIERERPYSYGKSIEGMSEEERRSDPNAFVSMPSGHTAQAFAAATIVYREYRHRSPWYGIGAYTLATSVAAFRMINDQHWQSDVLVGAGIGMLSANIVYATHIHRWGRKEVCVVPRYDGLNKGLAVVCTF